jgi:ribosomal protein L16 Arg81 hydroxylase
MAVSEQELDKLKASMVDLLHSPQADMAILQYLSRQGLITEKDVSPYEVEEIQNVLEQGHELVKSSGLKAIFREPQAGLFSFYIDGNLFEIDQVLTEPTIVLLQGGSIKGYPQGLDNQTEEKISWIKLITQLVNAGYWYEIDEA